MSESLSELFAVVANISTHILFLFIAFCLALTIYGFTVSLAGRPVLKSLLAED